MHIYSTVYFVDIQTLRDHDSCLGLLSNGAANTQFKYLTLTGEKQAARIMTIVEPDNVCF